MTTLVPVRRETGNLWDVASDLESVFDVMPEIEGGRITREGLWHPTMDVYNRKNEVVIELEVPGLEPDQVDITVQENHLIVEGTRKHFTEFDEDERFYSERLYGSFHRVVHLPASVDDKNAKAQISNGLLIIRLPKKPREGGTRISVTSP